MLPFLRLRHGLPPSSCSATSQACEKSKSIKRDHHNTNSSCASPMLWCTGLGSNSSTGSPKRNTNGDATYTYRCRPFLTTIQDYFAGPPPSSFLLLVWTQDSWDTPRGGELCITGTRGIQGVTNVGTGTIPSSKEGSLRPIKKG